MMEVWCLMGLTITNRGFHRSIFDAAQEGDDFEEIRTFRRILRVDMRLNLSRWEIMVLHRAITERNIDINLPPQRIPSADEDPEIIPLRAAWRGPTPRFPDEFQLCAVIGLAAMDVNFRADLIRQSDPNPNVGEARLESFLESPQGESPVFNLTREQRLNLNEFLQTQNISELLEKLHETRWVQPLRFPCNGGYSETEKIFQFFPQSALVRLFDKGDDSVKEILKGIRLPP